MLSLPVQMIEPYRVTFRIGPFLTRMGAEIGGDDVDNGPDVSCIPIFDHVSAATRKMNLITMNK